MLLYFVICILVTPGSTRREKLTIGVFLSDQTLPIGIHRSGPAVELGIKRLKEFLDELVDVEIIRYVSVGDAECMPHRSGLFGAVAAQMHHQRNISVIIGPTCTYPAEFIGRMAAEWNHHIFVMSGAFEDLDDKSVFKTLTRLAFNYKEMSQFYVKYLRYFNWTDVTFLYERPGTRLYPALYAYNAAFANHIHEKVITEGFRSTLMTFDSETQGGYEKVLREANKTSRVFLIACDNVALRGLMLKASELGMTSGDYAFLYHRMYRGNANGDIAWQKGNEDDEKIKQAYESLLLVSISQSQRKEYQDFEYEMKNLSYVQYNFDYFDQEPNPHTTAFYEAFALYGQVVRETILDGKNFKDGQEIARRLWNRTFAGINGRLHINANGDREINWDVLDFDVLLGDFVTVGKGSAYEQFRLTNPIHWPRDKGPPVRPECGYSGDDPPCVVIEDDKHVMIISIVFSVILLIFGVLALLVYRKMKKDAEILSNWWKISWGELSWSMHVHSRFSMCVSEAKLKSISEGVSMTAIPLEKNVASYKRSKVYLFEFRRKSAPATRAFYMEMLQMRNMNCPNLTKFFGLAEHGSSVYSVTEFCTRGDLRDILSNDSLALNREFSVSLIRDVIQAMEYLHSSSVRYHGSLHSRNCVIDSRFVLKVTNFGLNTLRDFSIDFHCDTCMWIAPELLRRSAKTGDYLEMQCADVYSFGIIMYEVVSRKEPFEDDRDFLSLEDIVKKLKSVEDVLFRPRLDVETIDNDVIFLMKKCWDDDPKRRPTFHFLSKESKKLKWDKSGDNLLDTLLSRMEEYANNLEDLVEERTQCLIEEKQKSDTLLYQVLPRSVADELKRGHVVDPEAYTCVTVYFSDIVGFTRLSSESTPMQIVDLLNDIYTCFDNITENFDVYKVETIGDAYMVVSGLPTRNGDQHVVEIAKMSCSILENIKDFKVRHKPDYQLSARIGIHSGPVCAGVVGRKMPRYCLFGDTVNTASRMESNGEPMKIHVSESTQNLLRDNPEVILEERGELQIKGKGMMRTFWLYRRLQD